MMVKIGNFLFRFRNGLFPVLYLPMAFPSNGVFSDYTVPVLLGLAVALSGQAIRILTIGLVYIVRGGRNHKVYADTLVTDGIFSHCRNPLYVGNILIIIGLGIMSNGLYGVFVVGPLFMFLYQAIVRAEENFLHGKFGDEFVDYTRRVSRWIPDLKGLSRTVKGMSFNWARVLVKEYNSTYIWTTVAVVLLMKNLYTDKNGQLFTHALPYLIALIVLLSAGYATARFLKKSGRVKG
jgi:protein-S-isoprenylcysteine O-methyltransferase Ste14